MVFVQHSSECLMVGELAAPMALLPLQGHMPVIQCVKLRGVGGACDLVISTKWLTGLCLLLPCWKGAHMFCVMIRGWCLRFQERMASLFIWRVC